MEAKSILVRPIRITSVLTGYSLFMLLERLQRLANLPDVVYGIRRSTLRIEQLLKELIRMSNETRTEFTETLTQLGTEITGQTTAINELAERITNFPDANDVTQADVDALKAAIETAKANSDRINELAVAAPEIPTDETPEVPEVPADTPETEEETTTPTV